MIKRRIKIRTPSIEHQTPNRKGVALLVVLLIVMVITILSLGFMSRSDVELACGQNMVLKTKMDYLAESGLEHARGLILNPQDINDVDEINGEYQLDGNSSDYYYVTAARDDSEPNDYCNYIIDCNSYRLNTDGEKTLRSNLTAELRLDPVIALWTDDNTTILSGITINGDMRCDGTVSNLGLIGGDVFANTPTGSVTADGQIYSISQLSIVWPDVTAVDFQGRAAQYESGDYSISSDTVINGMLLVNGDLTIEDNVSVGIEADKNLPALYVNGDLIIGKETSLDVSGLAIVEGGILINGDADLDILGGLFMQDSFTETTADSSGNNSYGILCNGPTWQPGAGKIGGALSFDGTNDYVRITNETLFDITGQITVAAWIRVNSFNQSFQPIVTKGDSAWRIQRWSNTNRIEFACTGLSHSIPYGSLSGNKSVNDGIWHHVAGVYDGVRIYLYIDGIEDVNAPTSDSINTNNYKVMIGANAQQYNRYWNGWIDDVRVYDRGLDVNDINIIKAGGVVSGLVGQWKFDESGCDVDITAAPDKASILAGAVDDQERWSPAGGAFYRSIERR